MHKSRIPKSFLFLFAAFFFLGENVLTTLHIQQNIWMYFVLFFCLCYTISNWQCYRNENRWLFFATFIVANFLYRAIVGGFGAGIGVQMWLPAFFVGVLSTFEKSDFRWRLLMKILLIFYIIETTWAITERFIGTDILQWGGSVMTVKDTGLGDFRSYSLWGHPLYNALIVSTIMTFILTSSLRNKFKYGLWMLGYVSILCFNTRSSIVGNALLLLTYLMYQVFVNRNISYAKKRSLLLVACICVLVGSYLVFYKGLGGRLLENGLADESSQVRVDVFRLFDYIDDDILYYGTDYNTQMYLIQDVAGLYATENFWIDFIINYGLLFIVGYLILLIFWSYPFFKNYTFIQKCYVIGTFLLIASTNNSLSADMSALPILLACVFIFDPRYFQFRISSKYLDPSFLITTK